MMYNIGDIFGFEFFNGNIEITKIWAILEDDNKFYEVMR